MRVLLLAGLGLGVVGFAGAQQGRRPAPIAVGYEEVSEHRIGPMTAVHRTEGEAGSWHDGFRFAVIVGPDGTVESAKQEYEGGAHADEAESLVKMRRFKPFLRDGGPVRAKFEEDVPVYPPERWGPDVKFPESARSGAADVNTVEMTLKRTTCYGPCPAYTVSVSGDGTVRYEGVSNVKIPGKHLAHIPKESAVALLGKFRAANFLSALPRYTTAVTDNSTQVLTLRVGTATKQVVDYVGLQAGLPLVVEALEDQVDEVAGTARWVKGDATTVASLEAEKWDFGSGSEDNIRLYDAAIEHKDGTLLERMLKAGAPATTSVANGEKTIGAEPPLCVASGTRDSALVGRMLAREKSVPKVVANLCLRKSAAAGSLALVNLWLERGADSLATPTGNWEDMPALAGAVASGRAAVVDRLLQFKPDLTLKVQDEPILIWAVQSCRDRCEQTPEIVRMLARAGADVNARDWNGRQPVFEAGASPAALAELLLDGADIEARNDQGETPLMHYPTSEVIVRGLLARGANPAVHDVLGHTAYAVIKAGGCAPCIAELEAALRKRGLEIK